MTCWLRLVSWRHGNSSGSDSDFWPLRLLCVTLKQGHSVQSNNLSITTEHKRGRAFNVLQTYTERSEDDSSRLHMQMKKHASENQHLISIQPYGRPWMNINVVFLRNVCAAWAKQSWSCFISWSCSGLWGCEDVISWSCNSTLTTAGLSDCNR